MKPRYRITVYCSGCGFKLYEDDSEGTVKYSGLVSVTKVYELHGGKCPACSRELSRKPAKITFKMLEEHQDGGWFVDGKA